MADTSYPSSAPDDVIEEVAERYILFRKRRDSRKQILKFCEQWADLDDNTKEVLDDHLTFSLGRPAKLGPALDSVRDLYTGGQQKHWLLGQVMEPLCVWWKAQGFPASTTWDENAPKPGRKTGGSSL